MENVFKASKRVITISFTLGILLGIALTCVYADSVVVEEFIANNTEQELLPMMASGCVSIDATTLHGLFDKLNYEYVGTGTNTKLCNGYTYTTG